MLRKSLLLFIIAALAGTILCVHELLMLPDGRLHIFFMDVGQGDSALIVTPSGKQVVIDGGPDDSAIRELGRHMPFFDRTIDLLILSHPDLDHVFSFPEILRRYRVGRILMTGIQGDAPRYKELLTVIKEQRIPVWIADPAHDLDMGDGVLFDIVWPPPTLLGARREDTNNTSIVLRVLYGTGSALFTGDMEEKEEREVLASGGDLRAMVLKAGHHGSKTSSGTGFLLAIGPRLAAISSGRKNSYGHPHALVLERLRTLGIAIRGTATEGTIELMW
ncbi:MBL fold metallo-hydrolase [Candidatus Peribacteria bacterium]|nr:MBL fold metallo-hydrolase [Candidatus Peribacteria bacterium]